MAFRYFFLCSKLLSASVDERENISEEGKTMLEGIVELKVNVFCLIYYIPTFYQVVDLMAISIFGRLTCETNRPLHCRIVLLVMIM